METNLHILNVVYVTIVDPCNSSGCYIGISNSYNINNNHYFDNVQLFSL